mmetsp:Transcript_112127/g.316876  ORF Transcript_112127/g.316876 Transcript_112127/m.316876 type:complete len:327 (+) Transcript_112127:76-1056(+)
MPPPTVIASGRYRIEEKLGAGSFGQVFRGVDTETKEPVAVKVESADLFTSPNMLESGASILRLLAQPALPQGFTQCFYYGREDRYNCMVIDLLGLSLDDAFKAVGQKFNAVTTALLAEQMVCRLEYLHSKCYLHRDIKPENFMLGRDAKAHIVYLIDFGLCKRYFYRRHASRASHVKLTGTARYASINAHRGVEQSRRDDLEAVGHVLAFFLRGSLPWSGLTAKSQKEQYSKIMTVKKETPLEELLAGHPPEFVKFLRYSRELEYVERPDYNRLRGFSQAVVANEAPDGGCLQWLDEKKLGSLEPLAEWVPPAQPDDGESSWCELQ